MGGCASQGTFSSFYYFKHRDQYLFLVYKLKGGLPYNTDCFILVIGKAQFRRAMLSCDSSCCKCTCERQMKQNKTSAF